VWHLGKLYLVGGYTVQYDVELKSFYQGARSQRHGKTRS
jgi:hypothetical protein